MREFLTQIFHYKRDATMRDLLRYAVFVLTFTLVVLNIDATTEAFSTNTAVYNLFLDEELPGECGQPASQLRPSDGDVHVLAAARWCARGDCR